jgi:hypothetical protein
VAESARVSMIFDRGALAGIERGHEILLEVGGEVPVGVEVVRMSSWPHPALDRKGIGAVADYGIASCRLWLPRPR